MRKIFTRALIGLILIFIYSQNILAQSDTSSLPRRAPGITQPIFYPENESIYRITSCDNPDVRIFPSPRAQSEVHISINKQNPQVLLVSANTFPILHAVVGVEALAMCKAHQRQEVKADDLRVTTISSIQFVGAVTPH